LIFLEFKETPEKKADYEEEKKGNKIIKWTPYPTPPKINRDFRDVIPPPKMTLGKTYPVQITLLIK
jgi:hypothetical protein